MLSMLIFAAATASAPQKGIVIPPNVAKEMAPLCRPTAPVPVTGKLDKLDKPVGAQKLNELPNADAYLTVLRTDENGCNKPAIVAYDIGSAPSKQR
jgi:hypothetical protein